jgi:hypothetical protein
MDRCTQLLADIESREGERCPHCGGTGFDANEHCEHCDASAGRTAKVVPRPDDLTPAELADAHRGMAWWNALPEGERRYWLLVTRGGSVAECWVAYKARHLKVPR